MIYGRAEINARKKSNAASAQSRYIRCGACIRRSVVGVALPESQLDQFNAFTIGAKIATTYSRCRAKVNQASVGIDPDFKVIDETKQPRSKGRSNVISLRGGNHSTDSVMMSTILAVTLLADCCANSSAWIKWPESSRYSLQTQFGLSGQRDRRPSTRPGDCPSQEILPITSKAITATTARIAITFATLLTEDMPHRCAD